MQKLNHFLLNLLVYFKWRLSGEFNKKIKLSKLTLKNIDLFLQQGVYQQNGEEYAHWYRDFVNDYLKTSQRNLFFPKTYSGARKKALHKLVKNEKIVLKDILLPLPRTDNDDSQIFLSSIVDSLLPYLIGCDETEICDLIFSTCPHWIEGPYEYNMVKLNKGDIVIDAGACLGEFSALAGIKGCKAYAFEPVPSIIENYLSKTAEWNPNITIIQKALSNKREELIFSEVTAGSANLERQKEERQLKVQAIDLDSFIEENNIPRVDFIKADIEGAERYLLMGAKQVLKKHAPKIAICTYHLPDDPQVLRNLILEANPNYVIEEKLKKCMHTCPTKFV